MLAATGSAQGQSGVYATAADYSNNKLTYEAQCSTKHNNVKLHDFFGYSPYITVTTGQIKHKIRKSEVYGFRNCNGEVFRFYKNRAYKLAEAGPIYIYTTQQNITQSKGYKVVNAYYFSTSPTTPVTSLTFAKLATAYASNEAFCDLLEQSAGANDASAYDPRHKTYKVNYLYNKSIKH